MYSGYYTILVFVLCTWLNCMSAVYVHLLLWYCVNVPNAACWYNRYVPVIVIYGIMFLSDVPYILVYSWVLSSFSKLLAIQ